jgi:hypothetical protein
MVGTRRGGLAGAFFGATGFEGLAGTAGLVDLAGLAGTRRGGLAGLPAGLPAGLVGLAGLAGGWRFARALELAFFVMWWLGWLRRFVGMGCSREAVALSLNARLGR